MPSELDDGCRLSLSTGPNDADDATVRFADAPVQEVVQVRRIGPSTWGDIHALRPQPHWIVILAGPNLAARIDDRLTRSYQLARLDARWDEDVLTLRESIRDSATERVTCVDRCGRFSRRRRCVAFHQLGFCRRSASFCRGRGRFECSHLMPKTRDLIAKRLIVRAGE